MVDSSSKGDRQMKTGVIFVILGLIIGAIGVYLWQYYSHNVLGWEIVTVKAGYAAGWALMVVGGGLWISGIITMIVKRK